MAKKSKRKGERKAGKFGQAAQQGGQGGVSSYLNLPEDVKQFRPKVEEYDLAVIGRVVSDPNDLDVKDGLVKVGEWWPRKRYLLHYGLTDDDKPRVCPRSAGKPCKACQERKLQLANEEGDEELAEKLKPKEMEIWEIVDLEDNPDEIQIFDFSRHKFGTLLEEEIKASKDEDDEYFYLLENDEGGRTINVRFSKKNFKTREGNSISFITATKINIRDRKEDFDEDWWEDNVIDLDEILIIPSDQQMEAFISQTGYDERDEEEDDKKSSKRSRRSRDDEDEDEPPKRSRKSKRSKDEDEDEDEPPKRSRKRSKDEDEDEDDDEPPKRSRKSKRSKDEDEDEPPKRSRKSKKSKDEDEDEGEPPKRSRKSSKKSSSKKGKNECPADGEWGIDNDQLDECETCRLWTKCRAAKEELEEEEE